MSRDSSWRFGLHIAMESRGELDHAFVQDVDDIPGGCAVCWANIAGLEEG